MAAQRYEIIFLFECWKIFHKWAQRTSETFFQFYYINTDELPNHFTLIVFGVKGAIYYVVIATVIFSHVQITLLFSHVKISSFRAKAHLVFHWCLYNKYM